MSDENLSPQQAIRRAIQDIAVGPDRGRDISPALARRVTQSILNGEVDEVQSAIFLIAMRMKRETLTEFSGILDGLLTTITLTPVDVTELIGLADPFDGFVRTTTMTPFIGPVLAACGLHAVSHGVETVGPKYGVTAHQVYALAGMKVKQTAAQVACHIREHGWGYLDQSQYSPSLFALQNLRDRIVKRTALTTLERLLMPLRAQQATHMVLGYVHRAFPEIYAQMAMQCGFESILMIKGVEGGLAPALNKPLRQYWVDATTDVPINEVKVVREVASLFDQSLAAPAVGDTEEPVLQCLERGIDALQGQEGVARDSLSLAAGQILSSHKPSLTLAQAVEKVQYCLDNGSAKARFDALIDATQ